MGGPTGMWRRAWTSHAARPRLEDGFGLVEVIVALFMMAVVVTAMVPFFIGSLQTTSGLGAKQAALTVASQQLEYVRSIDPDHLITGRNAADVAALIAAPGLVNLSADVPVGGNSDISAAVGSPNATVKLTGTQTRNNTVFTVRTYIDVCYLSKTSGTCTRLPVNGPPAYRVSVDVSWPKSAGVNCQTGRVGQCEFVSTTLIDASDDPVFTTNPPPTVTSISVKSGGTAVTTGVHPGQLVSLTLFGTNYVAGAVVYSGNGDVMGPVTSNTGTSIVTTLTASSALGTRSLVVVNPDGGSATTSLVVNKSTPTITGATPTTAVHGTVTTFTVTGTDFFATPSTAVSTIDPTLTLVGTGTHGAVQPVSPVVSNLTVFGRTSLTFQATFPVLLPSVAPYGYTTTGTLTLVNPDGGTVALPYAATVT
jgi:type II secretory pathway pseudopilin PulG